MENLSFSEILDSTASRAEKIKKVAEKICKAKGYDWVGIYDVKEKEISLVAGAGRYDPAFTSFPRDKGLNGKAVSQQMPVVVNDISSDEDYLLTFSDTQSEIIVPVFSNEGRNVVGTIDAASEEKNAFNNS